MTKFLMPLIVLAALFIGGCNHPCPQDLETDVVPMMGAQLQLIALEMGGTASKADYKKFADLCRPFLTTHMKSNGCSLKGGGAIDLDTLETACKAAETKAK